MLPFGAAAPLEGLAPGFFAPVEEPGGVAELVRLGCCLRCTATAGLWGVRRGRGAGVITSGPVEVSGSAMVAVCVGVVEPPEAPDSGPPDSVTVSGTVPVCSELAWPMAASAWSDSEPPMLTAVRPPPARAESSMRHTRGRGRVGPGSLMRRS